MSLSIETDLKEVLGKIENKLDKLSDDVSQIKVDMAVVKESQTSLEKRMEATETNLTKRIDGVDARLNTLIAVTFTALLGIIGKLVFFT